MDELSTVIKHMLTKKISNKELTEYINEIEKRSFNVDLITIKKVMHDYFYHDGITPDCIIDEGKMRSFLNKFSSEFLILAKKYNNEINKLN